MGVPKRVPSLNTQVEGKCRELGGINAIHRCAFFQFCHTIGGSIVLVSILCNPTICYEADGSTRSCKMISHALVAPSTHITANG